LVFMIGASSGSAATDSAIEIKQHLTSRNMLQVTTTLCALWTKISLKCIRAWPLDWISEPVMTMTKWKYAFRKWAEHQGVFRPHTFNSWYPSPMSCFSAHTELVLNRWPMGRHKRLPGRTLTWSWPGHPLG
jgi:hypothetical protein